jgi:hypothetical protein
MTITNKWLQPWYNTTYPGETQEEKRISKRIRYLQRVLGEDPSINGEEPLDEDLLNLGTIYDPIKSHKKQLLLPIPRIDSSLQGMMEEGFNFLQDWSMDEPVTPDRVVMPSGRIMDIKELSRAEKEGDTEAIDALFFYDHHVRTRDVFERDETFPNYSFIGKEDIKNCMMKYRRKEAAA